jgi:hypothetical protein
MPLLMHLSVMIFIVLMNVMRITRTSFVVYCQGGLVRVPLTMHIIQDIRLAMQTVISDRYVEDGSFVKLKTIQLGYTVPQLLKGKVFKSLRVYGQVRNALTFTKYSGFDPEISGGVLDTGVDRGAYPQARTYTVGLDIKL